MKYYLGIDLGGTETKFGLITRDGELKLKWSIPTGKYEDGLGIFKDMADSIRQKLSEDGLLLSNLEAIGIGVPGPVLDKTVINKCINLGLGVVDLKEVFSPLVDNVKTVALNDANAAALGELWMGSGRDFKNIVFITLGTGVGGGVVIDGHIVPGAFGAAGEIGHIGITPDEKRQCSCGNYGCLEQYASATGIVNTYRMLSLDLSEGIMAKDVFERADAGDKDAKKALEIFAVALGRGLASVSAVCDPQAFIIGGGVSNAGERLLTMVGEQYVKYAFHASRKTEFRLASLLNDAGIYGACYMAITE